MLCSVSIVIPIYNEVENVQPALEEIQGVMDGTGREYEIIFVDDGSTDGSVDQLRRAAADQKVKLLLLRRNFGQTAAMHAGIQFAGNDYIVTMDGDLQNDPSSIPDMLEKLDQGYDLVHGWRKNRQDKLMSRKLPSWLANKLISNVTGFPIHDLGCTLKAIKSEIAKDIELYGEMHRFIPILANNLGAKCYEMEVGHRARQFGESKYGIGRSIRVLLDLITINYMTKYFSSPMKLFGMFGFVVGMVSILSLLAVVGMKIGWSYDVTGNPLTMFSVVCAILSIQLFSLGLIGELSVRIYYSTGEKQSFQVREFVNFKTKSQDRSGPPGNVDASKESTNEHEQLVDTV
ncbi:MAG: glycosyltransferase family 2 protein [Granulosicoccus sp.]|nr:glycosyltransferase family 2 protein [Granulosicoccus sp.]